MKGGKVRVSLRTKINLIVLVILGLIMTIMWTYNSIANYKEAKAHLEEKGIAIARLLSGIGSTSLLTMDFSLLDEALNKAVEEKEVLYIRVIKRDGSPLRERIRQKAEEDFIEIKEPLIVAEDVAGYLIIGLSTEDLKNMLRKDIIQTVLQILLSLLITAGLLLYLLNKLIIRPVERINTVTTQLARGDLSAKIEIQSTWWRGNSTDEMGSLAGAINQLAENLRGILTGVKGMAEIARSATKDVTESSERVFEGARSQQSHLDETALSIEAIDNTISEVALGADSLAASAEQASSAMAELNRSIQEVAESAKQFNQQASEAASSVEELVASIKEISESLESVSASTEQVASTVTEINTAVKEVERSAEESARLAALTLQEAETKGTTAGTEALKGMESIRESVVSLSEVIGKLGKRSEEIGKIVNIIDEIAGQTSLLALNAAILAAQAGEHGKGFSVVADQIKVLAERTAQSTKEITSLIEAVQEETASSVEMVQRGLKRVEEGVNLVKKVNDALETIKESSRLSTERASLIQRATSEQANAIRQITETIRGINEQIEHISRATKEQSRGSRLIMETVEKIKELSDQLRRTTEEQSRGGRQITEAVQNVTHQAEEIAKATALQRERSRQLVIATEEIKKVSEDTVKLTLQMKESLKGLEEGIKGLLSEIERFRV